MCTLEQKYEGVKEELFVLHAWRGVVIVGAGLRFAGIPESVMGGTSEGAKVWIT